MSIQFITNENQVLSEVINNVLPSTKRWYVLVGYFYFSGFEEIYKNIGDKDVKILVGMDVDIDPANKVREYQIINDINITRGELRQNYYESLIKIINETPIFDSEKTQEAFKIFLAKIVDGTLEIRKTLKPTHAKLYIFDNKSEFSQGGEYPGTIITGSSNFTQSGLRNNYEINIISRDKPDYLESMKIFKSLWDSAVIIVDKNNIEGFLKNVVDKIWIDKLPKPFLMYIRVLDEYFSRYKESELKLPYEITEGKYFNLKYQEDAIKRTLDILKKHNGVIIADVVGLGKSIIASAVAHNLDIKTIIISPPHLIGQWDDYRLEFDFNAKIYSSGKIKDALEQLNDDKEKLIIIDEAHKYRNELTEDYADLHKLCQKNKVMLLTATPFNNRPQDVFAMIRLFQITTRSTIQTVDNLSFVFRELIKKYENIKKMQKSQVVDKNLVKQEIKEVTEKMRDVMYPVVIRRSRLDLDAIEEYKNDLKQQKIEFPKVNPPEPLEYDLKDLSKLYKETLEQIAPEGTEGGFIGARYMPTNYLKDFEKYRKRIAEEMGVDENLLRQSQLNLADFMRRLLVRRFESSIYAFKSTLESMIASSTNILDWYKRLKKVPIYKKGNIPDVDSILESTGEDLEEELGKITLDDVLSKYEEKGFWFIESKEIKKEFEKHIQEDIDLLEGIHKKWFSKGMPEDPKIEGFAKIIKNKLQKEPERKIVVFTEFADTSNWIYGNLKDNFKVFKYSSKDASKKNKNIIKENFDAGIKDYEQKNEYDVLIATDAISEGFNLHRAGIVFNYDIPYNPTRVIQRVGRINRINKKVFDELFIYNFFPTETGEREINVKKIATLKIAMIHALFGEDTKILTNDEELQSFFKKQYEDEFNKQEELSPEAKYENYIRNIKISNPEIIQQAGKISRRSRIRRTIKKDCSGVIIFGKKGSEYAFKYANKKEEVVSLKISDALRIFEAELSEEPKKVTDGFYSIYEKAYKNLFSRRTEVASDRGKQEAVSKIVVLRDKIKEENDYLSDLLYVVKELDALPQKYLKFIRSIDLKKIKEEIQILKEEIPHNYLVNIRQREKSIEEGTEILILSEELV